jgi:hypothetical protein
VAVYRYHLYDLRSGTHIDTLPLENVTFSTELRGVGTFTGELPLYADGLDASRVMQATIPLRTKIFVERDNALVWGGRLIAPRDYESTRGRMTVNAEETLGAFADRFLPSLSYLSIDQLTIARNIITELQNDDGGDMGLLLDATTSGVLRDRTYALGDRTPGLTALTNLSEVINGFEFATSVTWDSGMEPTESLMFGYPRLGRVGTATGLVLEYNRFGSAGGNVASYTWSDGPGLFTKSWATTETDEGVQLVASATNNALITEGYPLLEQAEDFDGIVFLPTLQAHADALSAYAAGHRVTAQFTVHASPGLELGDWQIGDDTLVRISDWRFPPDPASGAPGFSDYMRIVGVEVAPGVEGAETYTFTMADFLEAL